MVPKFFEIDESRAALIPPGRVAVRVFEQEFRVRFRRRLRNGMVRFYL
jgi:hypothetical protein